MPLVQTRGAASAQGFGEFAQSGAVNYIEDVFSTYLYTGTGAALTITNGIDLSTKGGLVWQKVRSPTAGYDHVLTDTVTSGTGASTKFVSSNTTNSFSSNTGNIIGSYNVNGFTLNSGSGFNNVSGENAVSWTFREQAKFFDVVTYTGTGSNTTIAHSLGAVPGSIIVKRTDTTAAWAVYHRSLANTQYLVLNTTAAVATGATWWNSTTPTSSVFSVGTDASVNASGGTYVAYLFAHDAGGFGLAGTDNVISCGSFTATGNDNVTLNYEPQWVMAKRTDGTGNWIIFDNMRGMPVSANTYTLVPNTSGAETNTAVQGLTPTATGFNNQWFGGSTNIIYIACRRGPMKVPTLGTSVYDAVLRAGTGANATISSLSFPTDFTLIKTRTASLGYDWNLFDRLRGATKKLAPNSTNAESTETNGLKNYALMNGYDLGPGNETNSISDNFVDYNFRRAPGFFDEVCYTGTGSATTVTHNLTVAPEMMILKRRSGSADWPVYHVAMGPTKYTFLDGSTELTGTMWNNTAPTSSVFSVDDSYYVNYAANTYVAYLFATCPGVSKVGSYTGTGALQTVACGFTSGARFVLIHRIDSGSNDWFVYDSARGITSGNDPYLALNNTAAEVTSTNYVDTDTTGFKVTAAAPAGLNANGGTYIFLAIA